MASASLGLVNSCDRPLVYGVYVSLWEFDHPMKALGLPCHSTRVPLASEPHFVTKLLEFLNRKLFCEGICDLVCPRDVLDFESPPFDHIVAYEEVSNIDVFGPVVMLCCASNSQRGFVITPQGWYLTYGLDLLPKFLKPGDFAGSFACGDELCFH